MLREMVASRLPAVRLDEPPAADDITLSLAHDCDYIDRFSRGDLSRKELMQIGFPWSPEMVERSRRSTGATIMACRHALAEGASVNLAGGTHHAHAHRGEGFCCFNDAVVASRLMISEGRVDRIAIIDLDVHQGNGTASMTRGDASIFTLSIHGASNFPFVKEVSDLDVELPDGSGDESYLACLDGALAQLEQRFAPQLLIYLAGADPYGDDRLGRLSLSKSGLAARDARVMAYARRHTLPVAVAMAGGYARQIQDSVDIHFESVRQTFVHWQFMSGRRFHDRFHDR